MGLFRRAADGLIKRYLAGGQDIDLEPVSARPGPPPKRIMSKISSYVAKYGAEQTLTMLEVGEKHKTSGITFNIEITREDIMNSPQFVVNAIQIASAVKQMENPAQVLPVQPPSGILKKMQDAIELAKMAGGGQLNVKE